MTRQPLITRKLGEAFSASMPSIGEQPEIALDKSQTDPQLIQWNTTDVKSHAGGLFVKKSLHPFQAGTRPELPGTTPSVARSVSLTSKSAMKKKRLKKIKTPHKSMMSDEKTDKFTLMSNKIINKLPLNCQEDIRPLCQMILARCAELEAKATTINQKYLSQEKDRLSWMELAEERQRNLVLTQKEMAHMEKKVKGLMSDLAKSNAVINKQRHALDRLGNRNANLGDVVAALVEPPSLQGGFGASPGDFKETSQKFQSLLREEAVNKYAGVTHQRRRIQSSMAALTKEKDDLIRALKNAEEKSANYKKKAKQAQQKMRQMQGELEEAKAMLEDGDFADPLTSPKKQEGAGNDGQQAPKRRGLQPKQLKLERTKSGFTELKGINARLSDLLAKGNYDLMEIFTDFEKVQSLNLTIAGSTSVEELLGPMLAPRSLRLFNAHVLAIYIMVQSRPGELGVQTSRTKEVFFLPAHRGVVGQVLQHNQVVRMVNQRRPQFFDPEIDGAAFNGPDELRAMMSLPIINPQTDEALGVLQFFKKDASELFTEVDEILASVFCVQVGASLLHCQAEARLSFREEVMERLFGVATQLLNDASSNPDFGMDSSPDMVKAVQSSERMAAELLKGRAARLFIVEPGGETLWHLRKEVNETKGMRTTFEPHFTHISQGLCGKTASSGHATYLRHPEEVADHNPEMDLDTNGRPLTCTPIKNFHNTVIAVLEISSYHTNLYSSHPFLDLGDTSKKPFELEASQWFASQISDPLDHLINQSRGTSTTKDAAGSQETQLRLQVDALRKEKQAAQDALEKLDEKKNKEAGKLKRVIENLQQQITTHAEEVDAAMQEQTEKATENEGKMKALQDEIESMMREKQKNMDQLQKLKMSNISMIESNQQLIGDLQKQRDDLQAKLTEKESQVATLSESNQVLQEDKEKMQSMITSQELKEQALLEKIEDVQGVHKQDENVLNKEINKLKDLLDDLQDSVTLKQQKVDKLQAELDQMKEAADQSASTSENLKSDLERQSEEKLNAMQDAFNSQRMNLEGQVEALQKELSNANSVHLVEKQSLQQQLLETDHKISELQAQIEAAQDASPPLQSLEAINKAPEDDVPSSNEDTEGLTKEITILKQKLSAAESKITELEQSVEDAQVGASSHDANEVGAEDNEVLAQEIERLKEQLATAESSQSEQKEDLAREIENLKTQLASAESTVSSNGEEKKALTEEVRSLKEQLANSESGQNTEKETLAKEIENLKEQLVSSEGKISSSNEENKALMREIENLKFQLSSSESSMTSFTMEKDGSPTKGYGAFRMQLNSPDSKLTDLQESPDESESHISLFQTDMTANDPTEQEEDNKEALGKEIENLKESLSQANESHAKEKAALSDEIESLKRQITEAQVSVEEEKTALAAEIGALQVDLQAMQEKIQKADLEARDRTKDEELIKLLREELAAAKAEAKTAQEHLEPSQKEAAQFQKRPSDDGSLASVQTQDLEDSILHLTTQKNELSEDLERMNNNKAAIEKATQELEEQQKKHEKDKMELQKKIEEEKAKAEAEIQAEKARLEAERVQLEEARKANEEEKKAIEEEKKKLENGEEKARVEAQLKEEKEKAEALIQEQQAQLEAERAQLEEARKAHEEEKKAHEEEKRKIQAMKTGLDMEAAPELTPVSQAPETEHQVAEAADNVIASTGGGSKWSEETDESGNIYYLNQETGESQWEKPAELQSAVANEPQGEWLKQVDADGNEYYLNTVTGEASWSDPNDPAPASFERHERRDSHESHTSHYSIDL